MGENQSRDRYTGGIHNLKPRKLHKERLYQRWVEKMKTMPDAYLTGEQEDLYSKKITDAIEHADFATIGVDLGPIVPGLLQFLVSEDLDFDLKRKEGPNGLLVCHVRAKLKWN